MEKQEYAISGITPASYVRSKGGKLIRTEKVSPTSVRFVFEGDPAQLARLENQFYESDAFGFYWALGELRHEIDSVLGYVRRTRG
jgi:hypothetical protein